MRASAAEQISRFRHLLPRSVRRFAARHVRRRPTARLQAKVHSAAFAGINPRREGIAAGAWVDSVHSATAWGLAASTATAQSWGLPTLLSPRYGRSTGCALRGPGRSRRQGTIGAATGLPVRCSRGRRGVSAFLASPSGAKPGVASSRCRSPCWSKACRAAQCASRADVWIARAWTKACGRLPRI